MLFQSKKMTINTKHENMGLNIFPYTVSFLNQPQLMLKLEKSGSQTDKLTVRQTHVSIPYQNAGL